MSNEQHDNFDDLEDFPVPAEQEAPQQDAPARRRLAHRPGRRTAVAVAAVALAGGLATGWFVLGGPGGQSAAPDPTPGATPGSPEAPIEVESVEVPMDELVDDPYVSAPEARAGDVLRLEPTDLPEGLSGVRQPDGTWVVVQDAATPADALAGTTQRVAEAVAAADGGDIEAAAAMFVELEHQDAAHLAANGRSIIVVFRTGDVVTAWTAFRNETGLADATYTAEAADADAALTGLRDLVEADGKKLGERDLVDVTA